MNTINIISSQPIEISLTERWKNATQKLSRELRTERIALVIIAALSALIALGGVALLCTGVGIPAGAVLLAVGVTVLFTTPAFSIGRRVDYGDREQAQQLIEKIRNSDISTLPDIEKLVQYGFISEENRKHLFRKLVDYKFLKWDLRTANVLAKRTDPYVGPESERTPWISSDQARITKEIEDLKIEFKDFIATHIVPNLPNPLEA